MNYDDFFEAATGHPPYPYQRRLGLATAPVRILKAYTGLGKTEAAACSWLWRLHKGHEAPRRLVYALPMRALVEQTVVRFRAMVERLKGRGLIDTPLEVVKLLGGDIADEWLGEPDARFVIVGTQDLLISRALNHGYALARPRWPIAFAWLNNDCAWVIDEVQLQGVGATTAAQLQGLREMMGTIGATQTLFMSATIDRALIDTVDHPWNDNAVLGLDAEDLANEHVLRIVYARKCVRSIAEYEEAQLAERITKEHIPGTLTLVVVNRVERAANIYRRLRSPDTPALLLHSQFRAEDREQQRERLAGMSSGIVVATQVVEAGVDIDAATLFSDLAPWSSIVQRLGRCNRRGSRDEARFFWCAPPDLTDKSARPYEKSDLDLAGSALRSHEGADLAPARLPDVAAGEFITPTLRRIDLLDLFDTTPDLRGNDLDVSRFIRDGDDYNVFVFWRNDLPSRTRPPRRDELCPAPIARIRELAGKLSGDRAPHIANPLRKQSEIWESALQNAIVPGAVVWLHSSVGCYSSEFGFDTTVKDVVRPIPNQELRGQSARNPGNTEEDNVDGDDGSAGFPGPVTLRTHSDDARREAGNLTCSLDPMLSTDFANAIVTAAHWHDVGKIHDVFQDTMLRAGNPQVGGPWAKSASRDMRIRHKRRNFRHEVVSALAWLQAHDGEPLADLIAYLVLAHHGKARVTIEGYPGDAVAAMAGRRRVVFGVEDGERVPQFEIDDIKLPEWHIDLSIFNVAMEGAILTWSERVAMLLQEFGPFKLAFAESAVRIADWRASASPTAADIDGAVA